MAENLPVYAALAGAAVGGGIGLVSGYLLQRQKFRRDSVLEIRERIYGPIFMEISRLRETVRLSRDPYTEMENLKRILDDYLFFTVEPDLKNRMTELLDRLELYQGVRHAAETRFAVIGREEAEKAFGIDMKSDGSEICLKLMFDKVMIKAIFLKEAVFQKLAPENIVTREKRELRGDVSFDVSIGPQRSSNLEDFGLLYERVKDRMEKESVYQEECQARMQLIQKLEAILEQTQEFVDLQRRKNIISSLGRK